MISWVTSPLSCLVCVLVVCCAWSVTSCDGQLFFSTINLVVFVSFSLSFIFFSLANFSLHHDQHKHTARKPAPHHRYQTVSIERRQEGLQGCARTDPRPVCFVGLRSLQRPGIEWWRIQRKHAEGNYTLYICDVCFAYQCDKYVL